MSETPAERTGHQRRSLDSLSATWLGCIWLRTMTYQTWLKSLKKLKRTWMPRRNPPVHETDGGTAFWIHCSCLCRRIPKHLVSLQPQQSSLPRPHVASGEWGRPDIASVLAFSRVLLPAAWEVLRLGLWC